MPSALLSLVQSITAELGIPSTTGVISSRSQDIIQILALMNAAGEELRTEYEWQSLNKRHIITVISYTLTGTTTEGSAVITDITTTNLSSAPTTFTITGDGIAHDAYVVSVDASTVTMDQLATESGIASLVFTKVLYPFPSDYGAIVNQTQWQIGTRWRMIGPLSAQMWEQLKRGEVSSSINIYWRIMGGYLQVWSPPGNGETFSFEYVSNGWVIGAGGTPKTRYSVDTDTCVYPDRLMINLVKMKYFDIKGFDSVKMERDYVRELRKAQSKDAAGAVLSITDGCVTIGQPLIGESPFPDTGYG